MQEVLDLILKEIKVQNKKINQIDKRIKKQNEKIDKIEEEMKNQKEDFDKKMKEQKEELGQEMKEQKEELNNKIDEMSKKIELSIDRKLDKQTKEIADLIHEIIAHMEDKTRKSERKLDEEILSNKIEHNSYNARLKKIEDELKYKHA